MNDYSQPEFYRFNEDSLNLVKWIQEVHLNSPETILDLGAGSGILGIEIGRHFCPHKVSFLELQEDFIPHLRVNIDRFLPTNVKNEIFIQSFSEFRSLEKWDLILSNPPYYLPGRGQASSDERKFRSRSFQQDNWRELLSCIERSLSNEGRAYIVVKNDRFIHQEIILGLKSTQLKVNKIDKGSLSFFILALIE